MKKEKKAVIFDIGGVLSIGKGKGVHESVAKKLGLSFDEYLDAIDSAYAHSMEGTATRKQTTRILSRNLKISEKEIEKLYNEMYKKHQKDNKELYNYALKLKKKGYKIGVLSDQWHLSRDILVPKKYFKDFDVVVLSCNVKTRKPNPRIFNLILKNLNVSAKEALFIDNKHWNVEAGKKEKIDSILFENNKQAFKQLSKHLN